jgi:hypothetical protein
VFRANASFDFEEERQRRQQKRDDEFPLAEPWEGPITQTTINLLQFRLTNTNTYNIYRRNFEKTAFSLALPPIYATELNFGYDYSRSTEAKLDTRELVITPVTTKSVGVLSKIVPRVDMFSTLEKKTKEGYPDQFKTTAGFRYVASSGCWGLTFQRVKAFVDDERDAVYLAQLNVIFLGEQRPIDVSAPVKRDLLEKEGT